MNPEDMTLSEISQSQKDTYCVIPLTRETQNSPTHRISEESGGYQGAGAGEQKREVAHQ